MGILEDIDKKLDLIREDLKEIKDMFEAMKILRETLEKWAKGELANLGGEKDS